jgi:hypothetical protein
VKTLELPRLIERAEARAALVGSRVASLTPTVTEDTLIVDADSGEPVAYYAPLGSVDCRDLRWAVRSIKDFNGVNRSGSGYRTYSATFGTAPRKPVFQREGCASTAVKRDWPAQHAVLERYAERCQAMLADVLPEMVRRSQDESQAILPDWRLTPETLWTSGVINRTVAMPYHTDTSNYDVWSAMPVVRRGVRGGHLHIPEYGVVLECRDSWCSWFPGHRLVHGVTPMRVTDPDAYRYSVVFYALRGMKDCATAAMETAYAQGKRTDRERAYAADLAKGLTQ